jgi:histidine triad (HIT) family protein
VSSSSCLFCRIVSREAPAEILHETETVLAFRDIRPGAPTHVLLIPKEHLRDLRDLENAHAGMVMDLLQAAAHLARTEKVDDSGWRLVANIGPDAGQSVFHLHFHLLGGRAMGWPPG